MAKIAMCDEASLKFCRDLRDHWEAQGHEVRYENGASSVLAQWADIYYVEWSTNNLRYLYKLYTDDVDKQRPADWNNAKKPTIVCRAIDWDVWIGWARDQVLVEWVDKWICIAPHIEKKLRAEASFGGQLQLIRPGVNLDKFTPKTKKTDGYQIGMVLGDMWWPKNHMGGLDIFYSLGKTAPWKLHIRGQHEGGEYWPVMYEHYLDSRGIRDQVTLYPPQDDMNQWYENIDVLLHPGMKETFCYAVGETMAKGIPVVVNDFYGSDEVWPKEILYKSHKEAVSMLKDPPKLDTRAYITENYSLEKQMKETDEYLGLA